MNQRVFVHRVDRDGCILDVSPAWQAFAEENGAGPALSVVQGAVLWNYIAGAQTRHLYHVLMERAQQSGGSLHIPYRCDSPDTRRFMEMELEFLPEKGVFEFRNRLLRSEPREPVPLLDPNTCRSEAILRMCSWCKKVKIHDDEWVEVEDAVRRLGLLEEECMPRLSHGICPDCEARFRNGEPR